MKPRNKRVYYVDNVKVTDLGRIHLRKEWYGIVFLIWLALFCGGVLNFVAGPDDWKEIARRTDRLEANIVWLDNQLN